jgi:hypothetical protein
MNGYRPPSYVSTAYRPCNNPAICSSFVLPPTLAVGAVGILVSFTDGLLSLSVYPSAGAISMYLASDYIHPYGSAGGRRARCRVRIYLPDDMRDAPVVICSELPNNPGGSITNSAEVIAAGVIRPTSCPPRWCGSSTGPRRAQKDRRASSWSSSLATSLHRGRPTSGRRGHG